MLVYVTYLLYLHTQRESYKYISVQKIHKNLLKMYIQCVLRGLASLIINLSSVLEQEKQISAKLKHLPRIAR